MLNQKTRSHVTYLAIQTLLVLSSLLLLFIGASITFSPQSFYESYEISLDNANLLSELRAPAGMLMTMGVFTLAGAFSRKLIRPALSASGGLYLSYALARLYGFSVDANASNSIFAAAGLELTLGVLCLVALPTLPCRRQHDTGSYQANFDDYQ